MNPQETIFQNWWQLGILSQATSHLAVITIHMLTTLKEVLVDQIWRQQNMTPRSASAFALSGPEFMLNTMSSGV